MITDVEKPEDIVATSAAVMTQQQAAEALIPDFKIMAKSLWPSMTRSVREDLTQEMCLACLAFERPTTKTHFMCIAFTKAIDYLDRERRHGRLTFMSKENLSDLSDKLFIHSPDHANVDLDPKPKSIPLPTHPVFRFLSQAV